MCIRDSIQPGLSYSHKLLMLQLLLKKSQLLIGITSVSYTHLTINGCRTFIVRRSSSTNRIIQKCNRESRKARQQHTLALTCTPEYHEPVSYTHLDVYQIHTCYYMGRLGKISWIEKYFKVKKEKVDKMVKFLQGKGALMAFLSLIHISLSMQ